MASQSDWIRFQRVFGRGSVRAAKALEQWHTPDRLFRTSREDLRAAGAKEEELQKIEEAKRYDTDKILEFCLKNNIKILTREDEDYPRRLREIYSPPALLYVAGTWKNLDDYLCVAVVGSRNITPYGERAARKISGELARRGVVTVSGLAMGIDTCCHEETLENGGKTIAVQGCGIDVCYPAQNKKLKERILAEGGAIVTEFEPGSQPISYHFPIRNRIIAGLCQGTLVVEGRQKSGSLITAGFALAEGRDVFAVPGNIDQPMSEAPNWLIREGASMIRGAEDILDEYEYLTYKEYERSSPLKLSPCRIETYEPPEEKETAKMHQPKPASPPVETEHLNERQRAVFGVLSSEPMTADDVVRASGLPVAQVLAVLTQLEIFGIIKVHAGHRFSR